MAASEKRTCYQQNDCLAAESLDMHKNRVNSEEMTLQSAYHISGSFTYTAVGFLNLVRPETGLLYF